MGEEERGALARSDASTFNHSGLTAWRKESGVAAAEALVEVYQRREAGAHCPALAIVHVVAIGIFTARRPRSVHMWPIHGPRKVAVHPKARIQTNELAAVVKLAGKVGAAALVQGALC